MRHFPTRPWFRRYWIIQEVVQTRKVVVVCGNWMLYWTPFWSGLCGIYTHALENIHLEGDSWASLVKCGLQCILSLSEARLLKQLPTTKPPTLIELLDMYRHSLASDPRDCIFSLLGLAAERDHSALAPDYNKTVEQTYIRYAKFFIENGDGSNCSTMLFARLIIWEFLRGFQIGRMPSYLANVWLRYDTTKNHRIPLTVVPGH